MRPTKYESMYEMREAEDAVEKVCKAQIEEKEEEEEVLEGAELCLVLVYHVRHGHQGQGVAQHADDQHGGQGGDEKYSDLRRQHIRTLW